MGGGGGRGEGGGVGGWGSVYDSVVFGRILWLSLIVTQVGE